MMLKEEKTHSKFYGLSWVNNNVWNIFRTGTRRSSWLLQEFGKVCGKTVPDIITSSDRFLWLHFKSDENIEYQGFKAVYEFVPRPDSGEFWIQSYFSRSSAKHECFLFIYLYRITTRNPQQQQHSMTTWNAAAPSTRAMRASSTRASSARRRSIEFWSIIFTLSVCGW